jgi:hypothetical protein
MMIIYITICITLVALGLGIAALIKAGKRGPPGPPGGGGTDGPGGPGGTGGITPNKLIHAVTDAINDFKFTDGSNDIKYYVKYDDNLTIKGIAGKMTTNNYVQLASFTESSKTDGKGWGGGAQWNWINGGTVDDPHTAGTPVAGGDKLTNSIMKLRKSHIGLECCTGHNQVKCAPKIK